MNSSRPFLLRAAAPALLGALASPGLLAQGGSCETGTHCTFLSMQPVGLSAGDRMGDSVAMSGKVAVMGAPDIDTVFVYRREGGVWSELQRLEGPAGSLFGYSVDVDRGRILVGAPGVDSFASDTGRAYLFKRSGETFEQAQELLPMSPLPSAQFGFDVALEGPWMAIGEPWAGDGSVDIFRRNAGDYLPFDSLFGISSSTFGFSLDICGDDLVVGDPNDDVLAAQMGAGHQYRFDGLSVFLVQKFRPAGLDAGDRFGIDVALDGDRLVMGANGDDTVALDGGAAYAYGRGATSFNSYDVLLPCEAQISSLFGTRVDVSGSNIAVGASHLESPAEPGGRAYVYRPGIVSGWVQAHKIVPPTSQLDDLFGASLAIDGPHLLIGAPGADLMGNLTGTAYIATTTEDSLAGGECPCEVLAIVETYGTAVPGTLGEPELDVRPMVVGESNLIAVRNIQQGLQAFLWIGQDMPQAPFHPRAPMGVGSSLLSFPAAGFTNAAGMPWQIPLDYSLCGTELHAVAFFMDPGAPAPMNIAVTRHVRSIIGY